MAANGTISLVATYATWRAAAVLATALYVLQFATAPVFFGGPGALIRVAPDGSRSTITTALFQPTGIVLGADGSVYVANRGTSAGDGEVLRITP